MATRIPVAEYVHIAIQYFEAVFSVPFPTLFSFTTFHLTFRNSSWFYSILCKLEFKMSTQSTTPASTSSSTSATVQVAKKPRQKRRVLTVNEEIELIDAVRSYPLLWDKREFLYRDRNKRKDAQKEIHTSLGFAAIESGEAFFPSLFYSPIFEHIFGHI